MRYIAVDPGLTTGIAVLSNPPGKPATWEVAPMAAVDLVESMLDDPDTLVVCESFIPRPGVRTWQPDALEIIGALRYLCFKYQRDFELQSPGDAKKFSTDVKLKRLQWYHSTNGGHSNDAQRHLLLALVRHDAIDLGGLLDD